MSNGVDEEDEQDMDVVSDDTQDECEASMDNNYGVEDDNEMIDKEIISVLLIAGAAVDMHDEVSSLQLEMNTYT